MRNATFPLLLIIVGLIWFLRSTGLAPETSTLVALLLVIAGFALIVLDGFNKSTVVNAPLLVYAGAAVYLHYSYLWRISSLIALGMVLLGIMMLIARSSVIPYKRKHLRPPRTDKPSAP